MGLAQKWKNAEQKKALLANKTFKKRLGEAGFEDADLEAMDINTISQALDISNKLDTAIGKQKKKGLEDLKTETETSTETDKALFLNAARTKLGTTLADAIEQSATSPEDLERRFNDALLADAQGGIGKAFMGTGGEPQFTESDTEIAEKARVANVAATNKARDLRDKTIVEGKAKRELAGDIAVNNVIKVSGGATELVTTYTDALIEGGAGGFWQALNTKIAEVVGGDFAVLYDDALAYEGIKTEVVSAMMPLLTQQGDKPGSVRLVATIFNKLEKTLPSLRLPGFVGRNQLRKTLVNMQRRALAANALGLNDSTLDAKGSEEWSREVIAKASSIRFTKDQQEKLDTLIRQVMGPLDRELADQVGGTVIYDGSNRSAIFDSESIEEYNQSGDPEDLIMIADLSRRDEWGNLRGLRPEESSEIVRRRKAVRKKTKKQRR